jgi:hypothetical protein
VSRAKKKKDWRREMKKDLTSITMMVERFGDEIEINVDAYVHYYVDHSYGSDADGTRGVCRTFAEDITDLQAYTVEGDNFKLTPDERDTAEEILIDKFLEG